MVASRRSSRMWLAISFGWALLVGGVAVVEQRPPAPRGPDAPADRASADRAMETVRQIASEAHPSGSEAAAKVRRYLLDELDRLGMAPTVQERADRGVKNILGVLRGTGPPGKKAVLLAAHYDSVKEGPGAGDDAAGVAAILEALRALKAGGPIDRDVIALITDREEVDLGGSRAFCEDRAWTDRVGVVLNFEARGDRGPSFMFETSDRNGWLIRQFASAADRPIATSLTYAVYKMMPNNTDLTHFKAVGLPGLNFAFVGGVENYHQPSDSPGNLDRGSLQHHGDYALELTRRFGSLDLEDVPREPDAVYFAVAGGHLVVYPGSWVVPLAVAAVVLAGAVGWLGLKRSGLTAPGLISGAVAGLSAMGLAMAIGWASSTYLLPPLKSRGEGPPRALGLAVAAGVVAGMFLILARRWVRPANLAFGGLLWWLLLAVATALLLPGGSYLGVWPSLFGFGAMGIGGLAGPDRPAGRVAAMVGTLPVLLLMPTTILSLCDALGPSLPIAASLPTALMMLALVPLAGPGREEGDQARLPASGDSPRSHEGHGGGHQEEGRG